MSGKVKMKCPRCGKHFKSSQAKQALCPECAAKERRARATSAAASAKPTQTASAAPPPPKIVGPGAAILIPGLASTRTVPATPPPGQAPAPRQSAPPPRHGPPLGHAMNQRPTTDGKREKPARVAAQPKPPREPREKRPPAPPFALSDELRARIEARYLDLAQPVEFDGIRTQIASELSIPKSAVKQAVRDLRARMQIPSWWDLQAYTGSEEDLARIRGVYEPLLPVPAVGIHKQIAADLGLEPVAVYQGIRRIRAEMRLPQYNSPELHPELPPQAAQTPEASPTVP
jgi:hypothetical protein